MACPSDLLPDVGAVLYNFWRIAKLGLRLNYYQKFLWSRVQGEIHYCATDLLIHPRLDFHRALDLLTVQCNYDVVQISPHAGLSDRPLGII